MPSDDRDWRAEAERMQRERDEALTIARLMQDDRDQATRDLAASRARVAELEAALNRAADDAKQERHNRVMSPAHFDRGACAASINIENAIRARIAALAPAAQAERKP